jgi:hypothetical protein
MTIRTTDQFESNIDRLKADAEVVLEEVPEAKEWINSQELEFPYRAVFDAGYYMGLMRAIEVSEGYED